MTQPAGLLVFGAGRMGRQVAEAAADQDFVVQAMVSRSQPAQAGPAPWYDSFDAVDQPVQLAVDFSLPGGTAQIANWCAQHGVALISGTTGLSEEDDAALRNAASRIPVLWAANFSPGIHLLTQWLEQAARRLTVPAKTQILDLHHVHKQDAPSGTALRLAKALGGTPNIESRREGEHIGEHRVQLALDGESLELIHRVTDRGLFARGALTAGRWLMDQEAGQYTVSDWLDAGSDR